MEKTMIPITFDKLNKVVSPAIFGLVVLVFCSACQVRRAPSAETHYWLRQMAVLVRMYETEQKHSIDEALSQVTKDLLSTRDRLLLLLHKNSKQLDLPFDEIGKHLTHDGWDIPFNVDYTTNVPFGVSNFTYNSLSKCPIVVWSSGPNHQNDHCLADDIPWPISEIK